MGVRLSKRAQVYVKVHGGAGTASLVGNVSNFSFDESCSEIDVTGWSDSNKQYIPGQKDAKGSMTIFSNGTDAGQAVIESAHDNDTLIDIIYREDGTGAGLPQKTIPSYITNYSKSVGVDAAIELSTAFVAGGTVDNTPQSGSAVSVSPASKNFSKTSAADVTFTLSGHGAVTGLTLNGDSVPVDKWSFASGTLTITDDYLTTLANATYSFVVHCTNGNATAIVVVGA